MKGGTDTGPSYSIAANLGVRIGGEPLACLGAVHWARIGRQPKHYNCGKHGLLTAQQIAKIAGCDTSEIYGRIANGDKGEALVRPLRSKLFDCGNGEMLTIKQIMQRTGLGETAVRSRISRGSKGKALLRKERRNMAAPRSSTQLIACLIADAFPHELPTTKDIRAVYPMCEQSAERWLTVFRAARAKVSA